MLVNPSIYNSLGRFTSNYDLLTLERKSGSPASTSKLTGYPYKNSLAEQINQQAFQRLSDFDNNFRFDLKSVLSSAKLLSKSNSEAYNSRSAVDQSKSFDVYAGDNATLGKQTFKVSQLASAQTNTSQARAAKEVISQDFSGNLSIKQGGKTQNFNLTLNEGESVGDGYLRMAKTINQAKIGVTAQVKTDDQGYARLSLTSNETGKDAAFEVSGTMAEELRLGDNQQDAKNMSYELGGKAGESQSNKLSLDGGKISIEVKATNTKAETFEVQASSKGLVDTLKDFASAFNKFVADNKDNSNPMTKSIVKQLTNTVKRSLDKLGVQGIDTNNQGQVVIDEAQLSKSLEGQVDAVKQELTKFDSFASNIERRTEQILKMPLYDISPDFTNHRVPITPYMYNYSAQSTLNNLSQMTNPGAIMDIRV